MRDRRCFDARRGSVLGEEHGHDLRLQCNSFSAGPTHRWICAAGAAAKLIARHEPMKQRKCCSAHKQACLRLQGVGRGPVEPDARDRALIAARAILPGGGCLCRHVLNLAFDVNTGHHF